MSKVFMSLVCNMKKCLVVCLLLAFLNLTAQDQEIYCDEINEVLKTAGSFPFGVASGDPTSSSVVLWTALNPYKIAGDMKVEIQVAEKADFSELAYSGIVSVEAMTGYTVKQNVEKLEAGKNYYYRFIHAGVNSEIGRTRTIGENLESLKMAVVSCSNYEWGYFNAYGSIAAIEDLDFVMHLGDYIYEHEPSRYGSKKMARKHLPAKEIIELADYRSRYAQYRLDPQLKELHRVVPFIAVWDDHEIANDAYKDGAQNHQENEGTWQQRVKNARQAYFEWMPLHNNAELTVQRSFHFGDFADLFMLDGRLKGRTKQAQSLDDPQRADSARTMLGSEQREWLNREVSNSNARWKLIGNQVIFNTFNLPPQLAKFGKSMDMWEGYPYERDWLLAQWHSQGKKDIIIFTGDVHASFSMELRYDFRDEKTGMGAEWVTPSVTSASLNEYIPTWKARIAERKLSARKINPHLKYVNFRDHGFMLIELTQNEAVAKWYLENDILKEGPKSKRKFTSRLVHSAGDR